MAVFYFTNLSMTALLQNSLPSDMSWYHWGGEAAALKPYLVDAHVKAMDEFASNLALPKDVKERFVTLIDRLCYPLPEKRGHPKNIAQKGNSYHMERFISELNLLAKTMNIYLKE